VTLPTPETSLSRCDRTVSDNLDSSRSEIVGDVSASVMMGASAGFTFE
jgi:hypothetical protein